MLCGLQGHEDAVELWLFLPFFSSLIDYAIARTRGPLPPVELYQLGFLGWARRASVTFDGGQSGFRLAVKLDASLDLTG